MLCDLTCQFGPDPNPRSCIFGCYPSSSPTPNHTTPYRSITDEAAKMPFTEINGKKIFYSWKPASRAGLTLFFIHGLGGAHSFWSPIIPGLVEAGFSCLAIDVPGLSLVLSCPPTTEESSAMHMHSSKYAPTLLTGSCHRASRFRTVALPWKAPRPARDLRR